jgi:hypothetical protein
LIVDHCSDALTKERVLQDGQNANDALLGHANVKFWSYLAEAEKAQGA